jgi:hypothetical protein
MSLMMRKARRRRESESERRLEEERATPSYMALAVKNGKRRKNGKAVRQWAKC